MQDITLAGMIYSIEYHDNQGLAYMCDISKTPLSRRIATII